MRYHFIERSFDKEQLWIKQYVNYLQLLLKFTGKLKPEHSKWPVREEYMQGNEVMDLFIDYINKTKAEESIEEFTSYHLLYILSRLLDYEENLEHLDTLILTTRQLRCRTQSLCYR